MLSEGPNFGVCVNGGVAPIIYPCPILRAGGESILCFSRVIPRGVAHSAGAHSRYGALLSMAHCRHKASRK